MIRVRPWAKRLFGAAVLLAATGAHGIYLDEEQNVTLRARIYSQAAIRVEDSQVDTVPTTFTGQLVQQRNFFNPELDAKLVSYTNWMKGGAFDWLAPEDLRFRIAAWGFYDGIYDYGSSQFNESQLQINSSFDNEMPRQPGGNVREGGYFFYGPKIKLQEGTATLFSDIFPDATEYDPRSIYQNQARVNELYLSYSKGPFFLRLGKQSISWGESDTVALLDQSNPFDLTLAAPGFFQDIDEARIPLWTIRTSYNLFDSLGPFSSGFVEGYWVPGMIDATTSTVPLLTASPYSPRGEDPQFLNASQGGAFPSTFQFVFYDQKLPDDISSSRWGLRFQTVINRFLTAQAWVYRTYPQAPVPLHIGRKTGAPIGVGAPGTLPTNLFIIALQHKPTMVYGMAGTFFSEWFDGIFRLNAQFFEHEAGFIPQQNLNVCPVSPTSKQQQCPAGGQGNIPNAVFSPGHIPYANILRYEIGFDRFFFFRPLNPSNSFILSSSAVGSWNTSENEGAASRNFHFNGQLKPGRVCTSPGCATSRVRGAYQEDFVDANAVDAQFQVTLQTEYLHGRLTPRVTVIQFVRGTNALHPSLIYRWNDWLLFQADYQFITGAYQSLGFFRDRDQVSFRVTYQLN
ncbi:MAG: DUF1302 family protein [Candidatus Binatia bacterium]